jgi:hypothetical protein
MARFFTDSLSLCCANVQLEKKWWISTFDCKEAKVPADCDCPLPSDVALKLPGDDEPAILLCDSSEVQRPGYERPNGRPIVFCTNLNKAHEYLHGTEAPRLGRSRIAEARSSSKFATWKETKSRSVKSLEVLPRSGGPQFIGFLEVGGSSGLVAQSLLHFAAIAVGGLIIGTQGNGHVEIVEG